MMVLVILMPPLQEPIFYLVRVSLSLLQCWEEGDGTSALPSFWPLKYPQCPCRARGCVCVSGCAQHIC